MLEKTNRKGPARSSAATRRRWPAIAALGVLSASFGVFGVLAARRVVNNLLGDDEFSGWTAPVARRLASGEAPYVDFTLPIPPGSLALMGALGRVSDRGPFADELALATVSFALMALLAFVIARPFTSRLNAWLVAAATLVNVVNIRKECVYDHTAQLTVWVAIALGARALLAEAPRTRRSLWLATGVVSGLVLLFKQSTATGILVGWVGAFAYLGLAELATAKRRRALVSLATDAGVWLAGVGVGVACLSATLWGLGSNLGAYWQAVLVDGPELKGGTRALAYNLLGYVFGADAFPASLALTLGVLWVVLRAREGASSLGTQHDERTSPFAWAAALAAVIATWGVGSWLLIAYDHDLWAPLVFYADRLGALPSLGLALGAALLVLGAKRPALTPEAPLSTTPGHALSALLIAALGATLLHNASFPLFRPFYDNNPLVPLAFLCLFVALDLARLRWLKAVAFVVAMLALFGPKFDRWQKARTELTAGPWAGLRVSKRGAVIAEAADRVRELAAPTETVLTLPEDLQLATLIDRPRPALKGAIVFVDQYPERVLDEDRAALTAALPKVIVIHPAERQLWKEQFAIWRTGSAAEQFVDWVLDDVLPKHYRRDRTYPTIFGRKRSHVEIWVREDGEPKGE